MVEILLVVLGINVVLAIIEMFLFLADKMPWNRRKDK